MKRVLHIAGAAMLLTTCVMLAQDEQVTVKSLEQQLRETKRRLSEYERGRFESADVKAARLALADAQKAAKEKHAAKLATDPGTAELSSQLTALREKQKEADGKARAIRKTIEEDPQLVALKKAIADANDAYKAGLAEKIAANADLTALATEAKELAEKAGGVEKQMRSALLAGIPEVSELRAKMDALQADIQKMKAAESEKKGAAKKQNQKKERKPRAETAEDEADAPAEE